MRLFLSVLLVLAFLPMFASGQPFQTQSTSDRFLNLLVLHPDYLPLGDGFNLTLQVYNSSGFVTTEVDCYLDLVNSHGDILVDDIMFSANGVDYSYFIDASILSTVGQYPYIVNCNDSQAGFYQDSFYVTEDGLADDKFLNGWLPVIVGLALFAFLLFFVSWVIKNDRLELLKVVLFVFGFLSLFFLGLVLLLAVLNPGRVDLAKPVFIAFFSVNSFLVMLFLWFAGFVWLKRIGEMFVKLFKGKREDDD